MACTVKMKKLREQKWTLRGRVCREKRGFRSCVHASEQTARTSKLPRQLTVYVPPHPLVKHYLSMARNEMTPPQLFRGALAVRCLYMCVLLMNWGGWYARECSCYEWRWMLWRYALVGVRLGQRGNCVCWLVVFHLNWWWWW